VLLGLFAHNFIYWLFRIAPQVGLPEKRISAYQEKKIMNDTPREMPYLHTAHKGPL
jgi:hypothetical protein